MDLIYHICSRNDWENSKEEYRADSLNSEGFIHCSRIHQVPQVLSTFYAGQKDLILLELKVSSLSPEIRWEPGIDKPDELFPHIFGPVNKQAVLRVIKIEKETIDNLIQTSS